MDEVLLHPEDSIFTETSVLATLLCMERVVYWLGAGFSAPLGLPVTSNFLMKSKDQFAADPVTFKSFEEIFPQIDALAKAKSFFSTDLFNVEEVLSLIEMNANLNSKGKAFRVDFLDYIRAVIEYHTPTPATPSHYPNNWWDYIFGSDSIHRTFGTLVASLHGISIRNSRPGDSDQSKRFESRVFPNRNTLYSVVTVNYDLVLERYAKLLTSNYNFSAGFVRRQEQPAAELGQDVYLAKLHGSVESVDLVPPTWNKGLYPGIVDSWQLAYRVLSSANHLRIIGYSLPTSDNYVRFLLKSAALASHNLKSIDVLCLDDKRQSIKSRYDEFIDFPYYRFCNENVIDYLRPLHDRRTGNDPEVEFAALEKTHGEFFAEHATQKSKSQ